MRRAHHGGIGLPVEHKIVAETTLAFDQPFVFGPSHRLSDETVFGLFCHKFPSNKICGQPCRGQPRNSMLSGPT